MRRNRQHLMSTRESVKPYHDEPANIALHETQPPAMAAPATVTETRGTETNDLGETAEQPSPAKTPIVPRRSERVRNAPVQLDIK